MLIYANHLIYLLLGENKVEANIKKKVQTETPLISHELYLRGHTKRVPPNKII